VSGCNPYLESLPSYTVSMQSKQFPSIQEQSSNQTKHCPAQPLTQAEGSRSGESPLHRRGLERGTRNQRGISLRRDPSCLGEMFAR